MFLRQEDKLGTVPPPAPRRRRRSSRPHRQPSALLGEPGERLLADLAAGYPAKAACERNGICYDTFRYWWRLGKPGRIEPYATFARRVRAAKREGQKHLLAGPSRGRHPAPIPPAVQDALLTALAQGLTYHVACREAGVRLSTFLSWLRRGGDSRRLTYARPLSPAFVTEPYRTFTQRVLAAEQAARGG